MSYTNPQSINPVGPMDIRLFYEIADIVDAEPRLFQFRNILRLLSAIGIQKGERFNPDSGMQDLLRDAAAKGEETIQNLPNNDKEFFYATLPTGSRPDPDSPFGPFGPFGPFSNPQPSGQ